MFALATPPSTHSMLAVSLQMSCCSLSFTTLTPPCCRALQTLSLHVAAAGLPLWVYPFQLLVTSNTTALMEVITDATSLHTIKARSPPGTSLSQHFFDLWGPPGSSECSAAQRRFAESLAGYSLLCYLLQVSGCSYTSAAVPFKMVVWVVVRVAAYLACLSLRRHVFWSAEVG